MFMFAQGPCQKRFVQSPKDIKLKEKGKGEGRERREREKYTIAPNVFIPFTLQIVSERKKKYETRQNSENRPISGAIFLKKVS